MRRCGWCRFFFWVAYEEGLFVWIKMNFISYLFCGLVDLVKMRRIRTDAPKCVKLRLLAQKRERNEGEKRRFRLYFLGVPERPQCEFQSD